MPMVVLLFCVAILLRFISFNTATDHIYFFVVIKKRHFCLRVKLKPMCFGIFLDLHMLNTFFKYCIDIFTFRENGIGDAAYFQVKWLIQEFNVFSFYSSFPWYRHYNYNLSCFWLSSHGKHRRAQPDHF